MKNKRPNRLERKLTFRMIQVQVAALMVLFGAGVFPLIIHPVFSELGDAQVLDATVITQWAESFVDVDGTEIVAVSSPEIDAIRARHPDLWLFAQTPEGASLTLGEVPSVYVEVTGHMFELDALDIRMAGSAKGGITFRAVISAIGPVRIITGDGPVLPAANLIGIVMGSLGVVIATTVVIVSAVVIPMVVRREMRGIKAAAEQAETIGSAIRGTRLSLDEVPQEVLPLVRSVNDALARLDQFHAQRERFLADSAHELCTPIAILQTRIETEDPFPAQTRLMLDVARLSSLADQLLDLQRMDLTGTSFGPLDLNEVAGGVVGDLAPLASASGYQLSLIASAGPVIVEGDLDGLIRVLTNLVQNAIAYGGKQGEIAVEVESDGTVLVGDQGPGIPVIERERIFEPFYRVRHSPRGAGLGLNLVETIVRRHRGHISALASETGGALFVVKLPLLHTTEG